MDVALIAAERDRRLGAWQKLLNTGGPKSVPPRILRDLQIYGGAQGIWVNKAHTGRLTDAGCGVTVGLLHTGSAYADDLSDDGVIYHYPKTHRPGDRDSSEILATKEASRLGLPVFVITYPSRAASRRDVHLAWVEDWDDNAESFLVTFGENPPDQASYVNEEDEAPFELTDKVEPGRRQTLVRPGQQRFKFKVIKRYGSQCAVCTIDVEEVLEAAHIKPKKSNGSNDPRNGLVLCATHHRAFDAYLFAIEPDTLRLQFRRNGPSPEVLRITKANICDLRREPHTQALTWRWQRWSQLSQQAQQ